MIKSFFYEIQSYLKIRFITFCHFASREATKNTSQPKNQPHCGIETPAPPSGKVAETKMRVNPSK